MAIDPLSQTGAEESTLGGDARPVSGSVNQDVQAIEKSVNAFVDRVITRFEKGLKKAVSEAMGDLENRAEGAAGGGDGGGDARGGAGTRFAGTSLSAAKRLFERRADIAGTFNEGGVMGAIGKTKMAGGGRMFGAAAVGVSMANMGINAANARFDRGREGVLAADRMSVLYQQMTGLDQLGVSSTYRMPLTGYRLGAGGINDLMSMEASIGLSGRQQASSVEAFRTMSGYSMSSSDVTGMLGTLASAPVANRMFMMTGTSIIGPGGTQRSGMSVMQGIVRAAGLTDEKTIQSALLPGSVTRSKLTMMGVPQEMHTQVIQYAQQNLTFQGKGGRGMYDPSRESDRRRMGIEENFATQVEETQRLETRRDENFYRRQVDNYAYLERQTQSLTRAFGALEDSLSGILGMVGSNRIATSVFQNITGGLGFGGDPNGGSSGGSTTSTTPTSSGRMSGLHPTFQQRLSKMMADNPNVKIGTGVRSSDEQRRMFLSRYTRTSSPTNSRGEKNIQWDGSYWEHTSGAAAAPPGRSMHEIGLAADLTGDLDWVVANAHKYGLRSFHDVNNEPWHVQPNDLPGGRGEYERMGAPWGHGPAGAAPFDPNSDFGEIMGDSPRSGMAGPALAAPNTEGYASISERVARNIGGTAVQTDTSTTQRRRRPGRITSVGGTSVAIDLGPSGGMAKSGVDITQWSSDFLRRVGAPVTEANLQAMSAWIASEGTRAKFNPLATITSPQSSGGAHLGEATPFNTKADGRPHVWNFANYEQGMLASVYHMTNYQKGVINALINKSNDPYAVAAAIEKAHSSWAPDYQTTEVLQSRGVPNPSGDPTPVASRVSQSVGGAVSVTGGTTINMSPTINLMGSGNSQDLKKIASELVAMIRRELEIESLRSS